MTCRVNWHGCTNFILHCELCICDTTYRLLLVQTGYTQEIYSLYKRCKYVYLKYVWRRWIKITFFHIHTAVSYSFMPQTPARCTCLRGFFSPARIAPHSSSSPSLYTFSFSSLLSISFLRANKKKKKLSLSLHLCLQPFTLLWPLRNVTFNSSNTQMSIAGRCLFLEYAKGSTHTHTRATLLLGFRWNTRSAHKTVNTSTI